MATTTLAWDVFTTNGYSKLIFTYTASEKNDVVPDYVEIDDANRLDPASSPTAFPPVASPQPTQTSATFNIYCHFPGATQPPTKITIYLTKVGVYTRTPITITTIDCSNIKSGVGLFNPAPKTIAAILDIANKGAQSSFMVPRKDPSQTAILHLFLTTPPYFPQLEFGLDDLRYGSAETITDPTQGLRHAFVTLLPLSSGVRAAANATDFPVRIKVPADHSKLAPALYPINYDLGTGDDGLNQMSSLGSITVINTGAPAADLPPPVVQPVITAGYGDPVPFVLQSLNSADTFTTTCVIEKNLSDPNVADLPDMTVLGINPSPTKDAKLVVPAGQLPIDLDNPAPQGPLKVYMIATDFSQNLTVSRPNYMMVTFVPSATPMPNGSLPAPSLVDISGRITTNNIGKLSAIDANLTASQLASIYPSATGLNFIILIDGYQNGVEVRRNINVTADLSSGGPNTIRAPLNQSQIKQFEGIDSGPDGETSKVIVQYKLIARDYSSMSPYSLPRLYSIDTQGPVNKTAEN